MIINIIIPLSVHTNPTLGPPTITHIAGGPIPGLVLVLEWAHFKYIIYGKWVYNC